MSFSDNLKYGRAAESVIARWLIARGSSVLPVYEKIIDDGKGPQLFTGGGGLVAPDLLTIKGGKALWCEAKHKTGFSWHRKTSRWVTGIDIRHYQDYIRVQAETGFPVWLLFLHDGGKAKDNPVESSPSGLFGNDLSILQAKENHRHDNWGKSGMVYWARIEDGGGLKTIASLSEMAAKEKLKKGVDAC